MPTSISRLLCFFGASCFTVIFSHPVLLWHLMLFCSKGSHGGNRTRKHPHKWQKSLRSGQLKGGCLHKDPHKGACFDGIRFSSFVCWRFDCSTDFRGCAYKCRFKILFPFPATGASRCFNSHRCVLSSCDQFDFKRFSLRRFLARNKKSGPN